MFYNSFCYSDNVFEGGTSVQLNTHLCSSTVKIILDPTFLFFSQMVSGNTLNLLCGLNVQHVKFAKVKDGLKQRRKRKKSLATFEKSFNQSTQPSGGTVRPEPEMS